MRKPEYLSPTSIKCFIENPEDFYIHYLSDNKPPKPPQSQPMSVGSGFDAFVKSYLHEKIHGKNHKDADLFELKTLFEAQVEEHNRDFAWDHGAAAFAAYKGSGALADLMLMLESAINEPRFEIEIQGIINGINFLGKPDIYYINKEGQTIILDWKVNGWCSKWNVSPMKGYMKLLSPEGEVLKEQHKEVTRTMYRGVEINSRFYLEQLNKDWAAQTAIYGWLCGENVGNEFVTCIDQIACGPSGEKYPKIRIAEHRLRVSRDFQLGIMKVAKEIDERIQTEHFFTEMSESDSKARMLALDEKSAVIAHLYTSDDPNDKLFLEMMNG